MNKCKVIPTYPRPRSYQTSIVYKTYNKTQANEMCPDDFCGPYCYERSPTCTSKTKYPNYPLPAENEGIFNFNGPDTPQCPEKCCDSKNEYCYRTIDNTGNNVTMDNEIMLIFGGLALNRIYKEDEYDLLKNCKLPDSIKTGNTSEEEISAMYLLNNCGYEMLNELWMYNINLDIWTYIKPYIDPVFTNQQKPYPRYGHGAVYIEKTEITMFDQLLVRKFMIIFGGYSLYCEHSCDDMWSYEIPYASQRFYPDSSYASASTSLTNVWDKGNVWSRIYPSSVNSPGARVDHSMTTDQKFTYIYLFGGMGIEADTGKNILYNDLWRYDLVLNVWEQLNPVGILYIFRSIVYWDGSKGSISVDPRDLNEITDSIQMTLQFNKDSIKTGHFPVARSSASMVYTNKEDKEYLILFGGYTWEISHIYNIQNQLNDMWVYSIIGNSWYEAFSNSYTIPEVRYGANLIMLDEDKLMLYGGINSDTVFNDLWLFNTNSNMWTKILRTNLVENEKDWPYPSKYFSFSKFDHGAILYGGSLWVSASLSDYPDENIFAEDGIFALIDNNWVLYSDRCNKNCSNEGICEYSRCICNMKKWGNVCQYDYCYNSFCYSDLDIFTTQVCYHCSNNGKCINGKCECDEGWTGNDCSIQDCPNQCSGIQFGICNEMKPVSQCECNQQLKRGGDDCSEVFCLNTCGVTGICNINDGTCQCEKNHTGIDCSIFMVSFRKEKSNNLIFSSFYLLLLILLILI